MSAPSTEERLREVLKLFLEPNYSVTSPTYLDLLLSHISEKSKELDQFSEGYWQIYLQWLEIAATLWSGEKKPCQPVIVFAIKLMGVVGRKEDRFQCLGATVDKLCAAFDLRQDNLPVSVKMAFTIMLTDFVDHTSGRNWIRQSGVWQDIVKFAHYNHTLYVTRESQRFLASLLISESQNREFCAEVINLIAEPLMNSTFNGETHPSLEDLYFHQNKRLCNSLNLISSILEDTLFISLDNTIPDMLESLVNLESRIKALFEACISTQFFQHVHKLWILMDIRVLKKGVTLDGKLDPEVFTEFRRNLCFAQTLLLSKKDIIELVKSHKMALVYWTKLQATHKFYVAVEHKFEHQVIALLITPLSICIRANYKKGHNFFEMFIDKLFEVTCHHVQRFFYSTKAIMFASDDLPHELICKTIVELVIELRDIMDRDMAIMSFQMMCHVLKNYNLGKCVFSEADTAAPQEQHQVRPSRKSILQGDPVVQVPILLSTLLNGITLMIEKFKFKWKECVETTCVLSVAQGLLQHPGLQPNNCVQALKLCKLAIQDFMPPNLALLIECDSHMSGIGPTLYKRLHDPNWEVRDSVFETLNTIASISEDKYPAFQDFILANQFLEVATDIVVTDGESYVRASALVFISTSVRINKLWDEKLSTLDLPAKAIRLLNEESEGIVRREAVILIQELYLHRKWPKETVEAMNKVMAEAAVLDLHWEVKVNALNYWSHCIKSHFTDQGMLDGSFPNMTFSKEHRKIVALNESEIKRRLNKALDELAKQSCLGVLKATLEDESDFEVSKKSAVIITYLKNCLIKYKVNEPQAPLPSAKDSPIIDSTYVKVVSNIAESSGAPYSPVDPSKVIDEIIGANDANLLASLCEDALIMDPGDSEKARKKTMLDVSQVTKEDFLQAILTRDIDAYIEERKRWLNTYTCSFDSILEDIVTSYLSEAVNTMDCY